MSNVPNFLEEEDYAELAPEIPILGRKTLQSQVDSPAKTEPEFGEKGYRKEQPNTRKGSPRTRITPTDAAYLAFAGLFPGADEEAFSVLLYRQDSPMGPGGQLPSMSSVKARLAKLRKLGTMTYVRNRMTGANSYSLTREGFEVAREFGYEMNSGRTLQGISLERLTHFRLIAHVAAQFISPANLFSDSLGVPAVQLSQLANENEMRAAFQPYREAMKEQKKAGQNPDYGVLRTEVSAEAFERAEHGELLWGDLIEAYPTLLTLGLSGTSGKAVHQPDLAVKLDSTERTGKDGRNLMVEIELSRKSEDAYDQVLQTIKAETDSGIAYNQVVYFTVGASIEKLLMKIDRDRGYGLFKSNRLVVLPILHRDGTPLELASRVQLV